MRGSAVLAVVSGGLDSVTLAHRLADEGATLRLLTIDYGQRHRRELDAARACSARLSVPHDVVDLRALGALLGGSSLTDARVDVPDGHYAELSMRATVVPNRNAIIFTVAFGVAVAAGADAVAVAVHGGDHFIYPDCRPEFVDAFQAMQNAATDGFGTPTLLAPYLNHTKADIAAEAHRLGVPVAETWSCYRGGDVHCGACGTCFERREAFVLAGVPDPTTYAATPEYATP